jgi:perosamine synthetase
VKIYPRLKLDITFADLFLAFRSFLAPAHRQESEQQIKAVWGQDRTAVVALSVRTAFDLLLQSLQLPAGSEVLMSAVNIGHMVEIVEKHHCQPVFIDLQLDTLAPQPELLEQAITAKSKVLVIAHLYGTVNDLAPYLAVCRAHHLFLVEDCAQAFAGCQSCDHPAADISLFSFGPIKSLTALGGAVALVKDPSVAAMMQTIEASYPTKSDLWFFQRLVKYLGLKICSIPILFGLIVKFWQRLGRDPNRLINSLTRGFAAGDILEQIRHRPPTRLLQLLSYRLQSLDKAHFQRRQDAALSFIAQLNLQTMLPGQFAQYHSYWLVPLLMADSQLAINKIRKNGFDATNITTSLKCFGETSTYAKQLIQQVVYLLIDPNWSREEPKRLAATTNTLLSDFQTIKQLNGSTAEN